MFSLKKSQAPTRFIRPPLEATDLLPWLFHEKKLLTFLKISSIIYKCRFALGWEVADD